MARVSDGTGQDIDNINRRTDETQDNLARVSVAGQKKRNRNQVRIFFFSLSLELWEGRNECRRRECVRLLFHDVIKSARRHSQDTARGFESRRRSGRTNDETTVTYLGIWLGRNRDKDEGTKPVE